MTRIDKITWFALLVGTILAAWLLLRPAPRAPMLSTLSGKICTPGWHIGRDSQGRPVLLPPAQPGPAYPPECELRYPFSSEMPLDLPGPPRPDDPADWWKGGEE